MIEQARGGPRRRINAPRTAEEARQLIAKLETQFELISMEDQALLALDAMREKFEARENALVFAAIEHTMLAANVHQLILNSSVLGTAPASQLMATVDGDNIVFTLPKE